MPTPKQPTSPSAILQDMLALGVIRVAADNSTLIFPDSSAVPVATSPPGPSTFTTRALVAADNSATLICATSQSATVNSGMPTGFGVGAKGTIAFVQGGGVTVNDVRTTGAANPWCSLIQTAANTYDVVGSKA